MLYKVVVSEYMPVKEKEERDIEQYDWAESALYEYCQG
jgi:hypothetical protein